MKVGIIQPNYIPWRGYFDFINSVELFVYLDDVQYTRRDWRNRNRIKTANGLIWLTVPVHFSREHQNLEIEKVKIDYDQDWVDKHIESVKQAYAKSCYFGRFSQEFFDLLRQKFDSIASLDIRINRWIMEKLGIKTKVIRSSGLNGAGSKTDRLLDILKKVGATSYLSGPSAKNYLDEGKFRKAGIGLEYKTYVYEEYPQLFGTFEAKVSVLDLLFNCGSDSMRYLKSLEPNERVL